MSSITVYTKPDCQPCKAVIRWLDNKGVDYDVKPAMEHIEHLAELGYRSAPVVEHAEGSFFGFNVPELTKLVA